MSLIEKFVIMFEVDAGQLASNLDAAENKVKNFVMAAQAAAKVDFSQMAKLPTAFDTVVATLQKMEDNLSQMTKQSALFNNEFSSMGKKVDQVLHGTSGLNKQLSQSTDKLDKGLQNVDKHIGKLEKGASAVKNQFNVANTKTVNISFALENAKKKANILGETLKNAFKDLTAPVRDFFSVSNMVSAGFERINEVADLGKTADQSRIAVEDLDALGRSARDLGGDVQSANTDIQTLADNALEAFSKKGSDAARAFNALGVSLKDKNGNLKDTSTLMLDLANATQNMNSIDAQDKLKELGIADPGMIKLIMSGKEAILDHIEAQKEAGVITTEQSAAAKKFQAAQNEFSDATKSAGTALLSALLPALTQGLKLLKGFILWCKENKTFTITFFGAIGVAIGAYAIAAGAAAIATNAFLWPILAIVGACAALIFVFNDIMAYMNGQPSILGNLGNKYEWFGTILKTIGNICHSLKDAFRAFWGVIEDISAALKALFSGDFSGFATHMKSVFDKITGFWKEMWNGFTGIVGKVVKWIADTLLDMLPDWAKRWLGLSDEQKVAAQKEIEEEDKKAISRDIAPGQNAVDNKTINPMLSAMILTSSIPIPANANQKIDIKKETNVQVNAPITINNTVDTHEAVEAAAKAAQGIIAREMNKAISNSDNAVAR